MPILGSDDNDSSSVQRPLYRWYELMATNMSLLNVSLGF